MTYEDFKEQEANLLTKIKNSDSPFLGLFEDYFDQETRKVQETVNHYSLS